MVWIMLVLLGTLILAASNVIDKKVMHSRTIHPFMCVASFGIVGVPVGVVGLIVLPIPPWPQVLLGAGAGLLFVPAAWLYYDALAHEEVSRVVPILSLSSIQTLLLSVLFFGETLSWRQGIAFFVLLVSGLLLSIKPGKGHLTVNRAILRLLPATTLLAVSTVLKAYMYQATSIWVGTVWYNLGMVVPVTLIAIIHLARTGLSMFQRGEGERRAWGVLIVEQTARLISGITTAIAIVHGVPVALTSVLDSTRYIWVWLLAASFLGERSESTDLILKVSGIIGISVGVYLLI